MKSPEVSQLAGEIEVVHTACSHIRIAPVVVFLAIDVFERQGWFCQDCHTEFKPVSEKVAKLVQIATSNKRTLYRLAPVLYDTEKAELHMLEAALSALGESK